MSRKKPPTDSRPKRRADSQQPITLKVLADFLGLSPPTVSLVLNGSPAAKSIPRQTQKRIFSAAERLKYRPNFVARSLRSRRSYTIGVVVPEVSEGYVARVLSGIEDHLLQEGFLYFVMSHRHRTDLIAEYPKLLVERSVEGLIVIDTPCREGRLLPVVAVSGHGEVEGITNIILDHDRAAQLALAHLWERGHRRIAIMKGQAFSSDTEVRWEALRREAKQLGLPVIPGLTVQLQGETPSPEVGYVAMQKLLAAQEQFTALVAFNDISAIGAIRALHEAGFRVPEDVSVVGFDDIPSAAYQNPALTTVHQPLAQMGKLAAATLLQRIAKGSALPNLLTVEPSLAVRETTCRARPEATIPLLTSTGGEANSGGNNLRTTLKEVPADANK